MSDARSPTDDKSLLTVAEVASALRVSKMTIYRLIQAGDVAALRIGRSLRVPREELERYLATMDPSSWP